MPIHVVYNPDNGKILRTKIGPEAIMQISDEFAADQQNIANEKMVSFDVNGNPSIVDRPSAFDAERVELSKHEDFEVEKVPAGTRLSMDRPDLARDIRGRTAKSHIRIAEQGFKFRSEVAGEFKCTFRDCFPFKDQTITIVVS